MLIRQLHAMSHVALIVLCSLQLGCLPFSTDTEPAATGQAGLQVVGLRCEYLKDPLGIDVRQPRLSWKLKAVTPDQRGQTQSAYRVLVAASLAALDQQQGDLWDSGEVSSDQSVHVVYQGKALQSGMVCHWKVQVCDQQGRWSAWSQAAQWSMGLLKRSDWQAKWIGTRALFERQQGWPPPDNTLPDPWLRKTFKLAATPTRAQCYVASVGYHELYVNGQRIGDAVLEPAVTDHSQRARYVTYDIAPYLEAGENVLALWLGTSWSIFPPYRTNQRAQTPMVLAQADLTLPDGARRQLVTDHTWKTHPSPNTLLGVWDFMHFGGELYDANLELPGWCTRGLDDSAWEQAQMYEPNLLLSAQKVEPNRKIKAIKPVRVTELAAGTYRVDMGVNYAGWLEMDLRGRPGQRIEFQFSERQDQPMTHRLHSAYVLGSRGQGTFRMRFNYSSGRWIQIQGLDYKPALHDIQGWMIRTDYARAAQFTCNIPLLNRIYETTLWTLENLSLGGYIVDCPQRERMGYGGDAHATLLTALNNYDLGAFYSKWAEDWRDVQGKSAAWGVGMAAGEAGAGDRAEAGNLPYTAPTYWGGGGPAWSGFCVTLPWQVYQRYRDLRLLGQSFATIRAWLAFLETKAQDNMLVRWGGKWDFLGDWLWPGAEGVNGDTVETLFFNNCYWIYNLQTAARIAEALGYDSVALAWRHRADTVRKAVHQSFFKPEDNSYVNGFQAYLALALYVDLPPRALRAKVWKRLEDEILIQRKGHIHAGITGGAFLFNLLLAEGRNDLIYTMALQEDFPGWGDMLRQGATTIWEDWEGNKSRLHSSYLYIGAWFIHGLAGIQVDPESPGFQRFVIKPGVIRDSSLRQVKAHYDSLYGRITSHWSWEGDRFTLMVTVPPNTSAKLYVPTDDASSLREGGRSLSDVPEIDCLPVQTGHAVLRVTSGHYVFTARLAQ